MPIGDAALIDTFLRFGLAALLGFAIGLERTMGVDDKSQQHTGLRDFVLFALLGAISTFIALELKSVLVFLAGTASFLMLLFSGFWRDFLRNPQGDPGITTEAAAVLTFFLGALCVEGEMATATAVGVVILAVLSQGGAIRSFSQNVKGFELDAALKLLVITFIVLPILPHVSLDHYLSLPLGQVKEVQQQEQLLTLELAPGISYEVGEQVEIYDARGASLGRLEVQDISPKLLTGRYQDQALAGVEPGAELRG